MASIRLDKVGVDIPIYNALNMTLNRRVAQSLRRQSRQIETIKALSDISALVEQGDRIGIVGPNGGGKTTLLRIMSGALAPTQGCVAISGSVIALLGNNLGLEPEFTGRENILRRGIFLNQTMQVLRQAMDDIVEFAGLEERIDHPLYTYSSGMITRLSFSIATALSPEILLIDEGLGTADAEFTRRAIPRFERFLERSSIVAIASHDERLLLDLGINKLWTLDRGSLRLNRP
jgi:ABC-type polysaccharide/polyol phosphate transport system ATPase subunit